MTVSASRVLSRELLVAQAAANTATTPAAAIANLADIASSSPTAHGCAHTRNRLRQHYLMRLIKKPRAGAGFSFAGLTGRQLSATERTATLAGALWTFLSLVDAQGAPGHLEAIQGLNCALRFGLRHVDEAEATRLACLAVVDELY